MNSPTGQPSTLEIFHTAEQGRRQLTPERQRIAIEGYARLVAALLRQQSGTAG